MPSRTAGAVAAALGCLGLGGLLPVPAFVAVGRGRSSGGAGAPPTPLGSERPRSAAGPAAEGEGEGAGWAKFAGAGLTAAAAFAAAGVRATRRGVRLQAGRNIERAKTARGRYNQVELSVATEAIMQSGPTMLELDEDTVEQVFMERKQGLEQLLPPMNDDEYEIALQELYVDWQRNEQFPKEGLKRHECRAWRQWQARRDVYKVRRHKELFENLRPFKPLGMKTPKQVLWLARGNTGQIEQDKKCELNKAMFVHAENLAGFTYQDFVGEMGASWDANGNADFSSIDVFEQGQLVTGIVAKFAPRGCYVEIGHKSWAYLALDQASLTPVASCEELFEIGQEIEAKIIRLRAESMLRHEEDMHQIVLSMTEIKRVTAWETIEAMMRGEGDPYLTVMVTAVKPTGAVVLTKTGIPGWIPSNQMSDRAGDASLIGTEIEVSIIEARAENKEVTNPVRFVDFPLKLSYQSRLAREFAESVKPGQVLVATVVSILDASIDVEVEGVRVNIRKVNISKGLSGEQYKLSDLFEPDEQIKVAVVSGDKGQLNLSIRALEKRAGQLLENKQEVFDNAEAVAKKFFAKQQEEMAKVAARVEGGLLDDAPARKSKKKGGKKKSRVNLDDFDDDTDGDF